MDRKEFESFLQTYNKIDSIVKDIVDYVGKENGQHWRLWLEKWEVCNEVISINYGYVCYGEREFDYINIPIDNLLNGTWKEYLKEEEERLERELREFEKQKEEKEKEERKKLYEKLKQEFE